MYVTNILTTISSHTRDLEPSWYTSLKDTLRVILGRDAPHECDVLNAIATQWVLTGVGVVEIDKRETVSRGLHSLLDTSKEYTTTCVYDCLVRRCFCLQGEQEEDRILRQRNVEPENIAAFPRAGLCQVRRDRLEDYLGFEGVGWQQGPQVCEEIFVEPLDSLE